ncbi:MAG: ABC transporter permease [Clostridiaceae bacterium]
MFYRKYLGVAKIGLQESLEYRFNFFTTFIFILAPLLVHICLWQAVYGSGVTAEQMAGYSFEMMITYTIVGHLLDKFTCEVNLQLITSAEIREGLISRYLVKPISYFMYDVAILFSNRLIYFITLIVPYSIVVFFSRKIFIFNYNPLMIILFILSIFIAILISFMLNHLIGLATFWLKEVTSLYVFTQSTFAFLAGGYFALDLLPSKVYDLLMMSPFPYILYFPISIYMNKFSLSEILHYLIISIIWMIILFIMNIYVWRRGLKRYTADGI